jgi:aspartate racemase
MKRLGIIGGIGPESTIVYYRSLMTAGRERLGGASPPLVINSIDVQKVRRLENRTRFLAYATISCRSLASSHVQVRRLL